MKLNPDTSRQIVKPCPKCGVEITLVPDKSCDDDWIATIEKWCCCTLCSMKAEARWSATSRIRRASARYYDWGVRMKEWQELKDDGITCGDPPKEPGQAYATMLKDGVAYFCKYLKLCGARADPQRMVNMLTSNPNEPGRVMYSVECAAFKLKVEAERAAGLPV
jgi:hypothetical protein